MADTTLTSPRPKLPVWSTVIQSYVLTYKNLGWFLKMAWVWLVVFALFLAGWCWAIWPEHQAALAAQKVTWSEFGTLPISTLVLSSIAVAWHRWLLLGKDVTQRAYFRLDKVVVKYFVFGWFMLLAVSLPLMPAMVAIADLPDVPELSDTTPSADQSTAQEEAAGPSADSFKEAVFIPIALGGGILATALMLWVLTRIWLIMPALALGHHQFRIKDSWRVTAGNFWRLFAGSILTLVPLMFLQMALDYSLGGFDDPASRGAFMFQTLFNEMFGILTSMTGLTFLSLAYRHFEGGDLNALPEVTGSDRAGLPP